MTGPSTVEGYLATLPDDRRVVLEELRATITAAAPEATETIAYDMPAYRGPGGRFLVSFAAFKRHTSLFPASGAVLASLGEAVTPFLVGKATLRFPVDRPIPLDLVRRVVAVRLEEVGTGPDR